MNIYDVSKKAGVSIATVSRVMNNNSNVSDKTRAKVLAVMEELGYTPNVFARGLGLNTMKTIGIMCCDPSDAYLASAIYHLERGLRSNGYDCILCCSGYQLEDKKSDLALLLSKRVDAIIIAGSMFLDHEYENNRYLIDAAKEIPVMLVNGYLNEPGIYCAMCDDYSAVYQAASRILRTGCRHPLYLYNSESYSGRNKLRGFRNACEDAGVSGDAHIVEVGEAAIARTRDYLLSIPKPDWHYDCIITSDDALAVGAVKFAISRNISVPNDLSIIGYNNSDIAEACEPELTSIDTRVRALCEATIKTLMGVINGKEVPTQAIISAEFIERNTTKHMQED